MFAAPLHVRLVETYPAKIERVIRIDVKAWDLNCG
jgi:hypothetical protein